MMNQEKIFVLYSSKYGIYIISKHWKEVIVTILKALIQQSPGKNEENQEKSVPG
jgi:hypothetical protein